MPDPDEPKLNRPVKALFVIVAIALNVLLWSAVVTIIVTILSEP